MADDGAGCRASGCAKQGSLRVSCYQRAGNRAGGAAKSSTSGDTLFVRGASCEGQSGGAR
jgi:hypothetical protein